MTNKVLSIIIPVYNAEDNLSKCLDSIIKQSYKKIEVLCINDGSTDNSEKIIDSYIKNDKRIKKINQENSGVSATRNRGIKESNGDFITFIDADDYIEKHYIQNMMNTLMKNKCEMIISGYTELRCNKFEEKSIYSSEKQNCIDISFPKKINDFFSTFEFNPCWKQIISSEMIKKNNIYFEENIKYGEDMLFTLLCYSYSKKTCYLKNYGYFYLINPKGAMQNRTISALNKYLDDNIMITLKIKKILKLNSNEINNLDYKTFKIYKSILGRIIKNSDFFRTRYLIKESIKKYKSILNNDELYTICTFKEKISLFLIKHYLIDLYILNVKFLNMKGEKNI